MGHPDLQGTKPIGSHEIRFKAVLNPPRTSLKFLCVAEDWQDLPVATDEQTFFTQLQKHLESPTAEA